MQDKGTELNFDCLADLTPGELPAGIERISLDDFVGGSWVNKELDDLWLKNYTENKSNIKWFPRTYQGLKKACIMVGASPAFLKQIDLLREMSKEDMFIIVACNSVFKRLVEEGVEVDYVFLVEGRDHVVSDILEVENSETTLIASPFAPPEIVQKWDGPLFFYSVAGGQEYGKALIEDLRGLHDIDVGGGNVISTSFLWAFKYLSCRDFIFIGMSLCYYDDYYFDGRTTEHVGNIIDQEVYKALDMYGKPARTTPAMTMYKTWLEVYTKYFENCRFINATEDGILGVYPEVIGMDGDMAQIETKFIPWWSILPLGVAAKAYREKYKEG